MWCNNKSLTSIVIVFLLFVCFLVVVVVVFVCLVGFGLFCFQYFLERIFRIVFTF